MRTKIRIIESVERINGDFVHIYVFCLPATMRANSQTIAVKIGNNRLFVEGDATVKADDAGVLAYYTDEQFASGTDFCSFVVSLINSLTNEYDFSFVSNDQDPAFGSLFYVGNYGAPGAPTFGSLMRNSNFRLPYMQ